MMKLSEAIAVGLALAAGALISVPAVAVKATGTASVSIVAPLSVSEVSSSSFNYTYEYAKDANTGDGSDSLVVSGSPHTQPITANSHSDPIMWGEFTISGKNYAQISVSAIENSPKTISFSQESAQYGAVALPVDGKKSTMVDLSKPKTLKLSSAIKLGKESLSGRYQPTYTVALHYE